MNKIINQTVLTISEQQKQATDSKINARGGPDRSGGSGDRVVHCRSSMRTAAGCMSYEHSQFLSGQHSPLTRKFWDTSHDFSTLDRLQAHDRSGPAAAQGEEKRKHKAYRSCCLVQFNATPVCNICNLSGAAEQQHARLNAAPASLACLKSFGRRQVRLLDTSICVSDCMPRKASDGRLPCATRDGQGQNRFAKAYAGMVSVAVNAAACC